MEELRLCYRPELNIYERRDLETAPWESDCPGSVTFDAGMGIMAIELGASHMTTAMVTTVRLLEHFGRTHLRAVVLHIIPGTNHLDASAHDSERASRAITALHALGVPVICSAEDNLFDNIRMAVWSAADYRIGSLHAHLLTPSRCATISERAAHPKQRALLFAAWLAHHPAIGLKHMLRLTRHRPASRPQSARP